MKSITMTLFIILSMATVRYVQAYQYGDDYAWAVYKYDEGIVFVLALEIFRDNPDKGARPAFMVNYDDRGDCFVSLGLTMFKEDIPAQIFKNTEEALEQLKLIIEQSDFLADDEVLGGRKDRAQALDLGKVIYARETINSDTLAAFMLAKQGTIRMKNIDALIKFDMYGFEETIHNVMKSYCK